MADDKSIAAEGVSVAGDLEVVKRDTAHRMLDYRHWWLFCLLVVALKFLLLGLDPLPKIFVGDSLSYIWTAVAGWIPEDRSYFYGYVIRWSSLATGSLSSLLILQAAISALTAILVALICRSILNLSERLAYLFGLLCALDPLQLLWERYVMTETISLFLFALVLYFALFYLKRRRISDLLLLQLFSSFLIGFRMSFLALVQLNTVLLPLLAFSPEFLTLARAGWSARRMWVRTLQPIGLHLLTSVVLMVLLHSGYKRLNGRLSHKEPAYLYVTGLHLLAFWAPALEPVDAPDPRLADLIERGYEFQIKDLASRNAQRFEIDFLIDRLAKIEPDTAKADNLAKQTALHALRRDPLKIVKMGLQTYAGFWKPAALKAYAELDFSLRNLPDDEKRRLIASRFHQTIDTNPNAQQKTLLQWYYLRAWPYFYLVLVSPVLAGLAVFFSRTQRFAVLILVHDFVLVAVSVILAPQPVVRYLQPISLLTILGVALCIKGWGVRKEASGPAAVG